MFFLLIPFIIVYVFKKLFLKKTLPSLKSKHVVITGGSSGIGKSFAKLVVKCGAHVTIIGRNMNKLDTALAEIEKERIDSNQHIQSVSLDVTNYANVEKVLHTIDSSIAPIYMLVNCAGLAICGKLEDMSVSDIETVVNTNFLGTVYPIKAIIPQLKKRNEGYIIITSSQAGLVGIFGLSTYTGSKFALRGFAEALNMELEPHNIGVTVGVPPDTDTPGLETENKTKPIETRLISETGGLFNPDDIARRMLDDTLSGKFFSYMGFESFMTTTLCVGMSKASSIFEIILQSLLLGPLRIVACFYLASFHRIIKKTSCNEKKLN